MNDRGFQLIEVLIVCALFAALSGFGIAQMTGIQNRYRLESAAQALVADMAKARALAIVHNSSLTLETRADGIAYRVTTPDTAAQAAWNSLPAGVAFQAVPQRGITFFSRGSAAPAGSFKLGNPAGEIRVVVAVSGRIRWERP